MDLKYDSKSHWFILEEFTRATMVVKEISKHRVKGEKLNIAKTPP